MWALAILIIPAFVIWGAGSADKNKNNKPDYAGKIYGKKISYEDYYDMWNVVRDYAIKSFGNNIPMEFIDQMAWRRIIMLKEAKRQNIIVTDKDVVEKLVSFQAFQRDGSFDKRLYKSMLQDSARAFEEKLRDDLLLSKLKDKIASDVNVNDQDVKNEYKKRYEKIRSSYVLIPFSESEKDAQLDNAGLENFYAQNKQSFRKNEQVDVKYIEIPYSKFESEVNVSEEQIKRFFEEHIKDFKKPESNESAALDDNIKNSIREKLALQKKVSLAEELAYKVLDQAAQKNNLEEPAMANSLTIKETGFFSADEEVPGIGWSYDFSRMAFELQKNEISKTLVKTDKGLCIMQLKNKKDPYAPSYEEIRDAVKKAFLKEESVKLSRKKAEKIYLDIASDIKAGETFEKAAKKYGLQLKQTDFITRDGYIPEIGPAGEFVNTATSLNIGSISEPLKTLQGWIILEPLEIKPVDEIKFMEEKDKFKESLLANRKEEAFNKYFQDLLKRADFVSYTNRK